jgi:hypothetical protein
VFDWDEPRTAGPGWQQDGDQLQRGEDGVHNGASDDLSFLLAGRRAQSASLPTTAPIEDAAPPPGADA